MPTAKYPVHLPVHSSDLLSGFVPLFHTVPTEHRQTYPESSTADQDFLRHTPHIAEGMDTLTNRHNS